MLVSDPVTAGTFTSLEFSLTAINNFRLSISGLLLVESIFSSSRYDRKLHIKAESLRNVPSDITLPDPSTRFIGHASFRLRLMSFDPAPQFWKVVRP